MTIHMPIARCAAVLFLAAIAASGSAAAGEARIAVAANFAEPAREIGALFEAATGHDIVFSFGSTGQLYAQLSQGAPFDAFLAADRARPELAEQEGLAVAQSRFTYATGRLVLYSADPQRIDGPRTLTDNAFTRIAIANPLTAPYGVAAVETMQALGVLDALEAKIVRGSNIAQAYQFVETGNAELGFVALSQVIDRDAGSRWIVPETLHAAIAQDAVLLAHSAGNEAARAFLEFLRGPEAGAVKAKFGYGTGNR